MTTTTTTTTAAIRAIAKKFNFQEIRRSSDVLLFHRKALSLKEFAQRVLDDGESGSTLPHLLFPCYIEAYLKTGDVGTYIPHLRQKAYRIFHINALSSVDNVEQVFKTPWSDVQFDYRLSDMLTDPANNSVPTSIILSLSAVSALERQIAVIDRELGDLRQERQDLRRRYTQLSKITKANSATVWDTTQQATTNSDDGLFLVPSADSRTRNAAAAPQMLLDPGQEVAAGSRGEAREPSNGSSSMYTMHSGGGGLTNRSLGGSGGDRIRGNKGIWSMFFPDAQEEFARAWQLKPVSSVALGRGYVVTYDDGSVTWCDISPLLETKLRQQGLFPLSTLSPGSMKGSRTESGTSSTTRIRYIVIGSESSFYVKFDNGRMEWCGQDNFGATLRRGVTDKRLMVDKVAFGQNGSWLVLWSDGTFEAEGIPATLADRLRRSGTGSAPGSKATASGSSPRTPERISGVASGIKNITIGPIGEWFIIYKDHSVQADNLPDSLYKSLSQIRERSGRVRSIAFGENRSWFVRYWDGSKL